MTRKYSTENNFRILHSLTSCLHRFPLNLPPIQTLPNNGKFTGHAMFVPNLVSGSAGEWNRMAKLIIWAFKRNEKVVKDEKKKTESTDMYAARFLYKTMNAFLAEQSTAQINEFYLDEVKQKNTKSIDPYQLSKKCFVSNDMKAVHFSHWSCSQVWFCRDTASKNSNSTLHFQRSKVVQKWLEAWNTQCKKKS